MRQSYLWSFLSLLLLFSCTKKEITIQQTNETEIVDGNIAPPFNGVTTIQIQNYVNKIYIDLVGREPSQSQLDDHAAFLKSNNLNEESRDQIMVDLMNSTAYYDRLFEVYSGNILGGFTMENVVDEIASLDFIIDLFMQQGDMFTVQILENDKQRYVRLLNATTELAADEITMNVFIGRMLNNSVFEEINMGSENFAIASFENLFKRQPTNSELENATTMVDGISAQLLFSDGLSKSDFIEIMTNNAEFYQGLTIDIYQILLARRPDSPEMTAATLALSDNQDFKTVQRQVMKTAEYAGF